MRALGFDHIGEFAGIPATGNAVRVPYSVFYELDGAAITALRIYMPMDQLIEQTRQSAATSSAGAGAKRRDAASGRNAAEPP